jgi:threonylcarbamoyladenosine tRNA methylthiotransferase MtaB
VRVLLTNLGCKVNQAETDQLAREFSAAGHRLVDELGEADLHIVNTCTVTATAARDSRRAARRAVREGSGERVRTLLTGCYAASQPEEAAALPGVALVVHEKDQIVETVHARWGQAAVEDASALLPPARGTRALLKIEDGCDVRCSFCVIPKTRGHQRSRSLSAVLADARQMIEGGHRELLVTGVQISSWRQDRLRLADLVTALLDELPEDGVRLRVSSIAPWQFDRRLLALWSDPHLCRHVHLALQSGSGSTLARMRRPSRPDRFEALVAEIRAAVPGMAITTDVIVGFPGETEEEFGESLAVVERIGFSRVHVFPFSPRPETLGAELPESVPTEVQRRRMDRMLAVAAASEKAFWQRQVGQRTQVLWEKPRRGLGNGLTDTYLRVWSPEAAELRNALSEVEIVGCSADGLIGRLVG